jgi:adenylylsulfate kinase
MLLAMAGLPGTGKSTVARALKSALERQGQEVHILDKDNVRAAIFPKGPVEYSREQDDLCVNVMLQVAAFLLRQAPERVIILDGRTYSHHDQVDAVVYQAQRIPAAVHFVECRCSTATALARLEADTKKGEHPAQNRNGELYYRVSAQAEPLAAEHHLCIDTDQPLEDNVAKVVTYLNGERGSVGPQA